MGRWIGLAAVAAVAGLTGACASLPMGRAAIEKPAAGCQAVNVSLYFDQNSSRVTRDARAVLRTAAAQVRGCRIDSVRVLGLADAPGAPGANLELSKARADAVTRALGAVGLRNATFEVAAAGDAGSVNGQGEARPLRRRADVMIAASAAR